MSASRTCVACGESGHTVTTCSTRAAAIIRDLRVKLKLKREGQKRKPKTSGSKRRGEDKKQARERYTPQSHLARRKLARRVPKNERKGKGLLSMVGGDDLVALQKLKDAGYYV